MFFAQADKEKEQLQAEIEQLKLEIEKAAALRSRVLSCFEPIVARENMSFARNVVMESSINMLIWAVKIG